MLAPPSLHMMAFNEADGNDTSGNHTHYHPTVLTKCADCLVSAVFPVSSASPVPAHRRLQLLQTNIHPQGNLLGNQKRPLLPGVSTLMMMTHPARAVN